MGNGEQYIWKPPEEEDVILLQNKALGPLGAITVENIQPSAAVVSEDTQIGGKTSASFCYLVHFYTFTASVYSASLTTR